MSILNKLTIKHLKMNKKRTIVTIIGVILSTSLMVGIGLLLSTFREMMIEENIANVGNYHLAISGLDGDNLKEISKNVNIDSIYSRALLGYANNNVYEYKPYYKIVAADNNYLHHLTLIKGRLPKDDKEILVPKHLSELTGLNYNLGDEITVNLGKRVLDGVDVDSTYFVDGEQIVTSDINKTYKVVGLVERDILESFSDPGFSLYTYTPNLKDHIDSYILV